MKVKQKKIMTHGQIYQIMQWLPIVVASGFFVMNALKGNTTAMLAIGVSLAVYTVVFVVANIRKTNLYKKEFILSIALPILIFMISLFSGASYSDDFSLFISVVAMSGMFLEPKYTLVQIPLIDVLLVLMYVIHPEKTEGRSQYILCVACFTLAGVLVYQVIKRGKAFIDISEERAKESEKLLNSIRELGEELRSDFDASSVKIDHGTEGLKEGSDMIAKGSGEVAESCDIAKDKIEQAQFQIQDLNNEVQAFEKKLVENEKNVTTMNRQIDTVNMLISESGIVFRTLESEMKEIVGIAKQISDISFRLTILSLNAAVESARAGEYGVGFDVIATEMRELSETSGGFASKVEEVVHQMQERVVETSEQFVSSEKAITETKEAMKNLVYSFKLLNQQFEDLYINIESQNHNIIEMDSVFSDLEQKVSSMNLSSDENKSAVESISDAMKEYRISIEKIVENTQNI